MLTTPHLARAASVRHGFFTREGGVSTGLYASLNCGFGSADKPDRVSENRARVAVRLGIEARFLLTCHQVHSSEVVTVEAPWPRQASPRADAMVTRVPGLALGILTADCAPVLLHDEAAGVVGAAHAGWRGAVSGILDGTVTAMVRLGAEPGRLVAAIGPAIGPLSYEVGADFVATFLAQDARSAQFFVEGARAGKSLFDLVGYVEHRLRAVGVTRIERTGGDTAAEPDRFFSYRRSCLLGEPDYGREISAIVLGRSLAASSSGHDLA